MKTTLIVLLVLIVHASALDIVVGKRAYVNCTNVRAEGAELLFMHSEGSARVRYDALPAALQEKYFGAEKIAALRAQERASAEAAAAEHERRRVAAEQAETEKQTRIATNQRDYEAAQARAAAAAAAKAAAAPATPAPPRPSDHPSALADYNARTGRLNIDTSGAVEAAMERERRETALAEARRRERETEAAEMHAAWAKANEWSGVDMLVWAIGAIVAGFIYFLPTLMASGQKKINTGAIFVLNLFLGWTLIGWVVALTWASTKEAPAT